MPVKERQRDKSSRYLQSSATCSLSNLVQGRRAHVLVLIGLLINSDNSDQKNCVACPSFLFLLYPPLPSSLTTSEMDVREWPLIISQISNVDHDSDLFSSLITFNLCTICSFKRPQMTLLSSKPYAVLHFPNLLLMFI